MIRSKPESDMQFVFYNENDFFPIEDAVKNKKLNKVRSVEYVYFMGKKYC